MWKKFAGAAAAAVILASAHTAHAKTEIELWHAMGGNLGERVIEIASLFNAAQSDYEVKPVYKGNYTETMTAAIAAFRANEQPHVVQVFEVGTATMMAAKGAVYPVYQMMADAVIDWDPNAYLPAVKSYYTEPKAICCRCRSTAPRRCCGTIRTCSTRLASKSRRPGMRCSPPLTRSGPPALSAASASAGSHG